MLDITPAGLWLLIGISCLIIEFIKLPSIGFLFLGLGGLANAILTYNYQLSIEYQLMSFGFFSLVWFLILWFPLKKFIRRDQVSKNSFDIIGSEVEVFAQDIFPNNIGQVKWSGTYMNARLNVKEILPAKVGDKLIITEVHGNILICRKSH